MESAVKVGEQTALSPPSSKEDRSNPTLTLTLTLALALTTSPRVQGTQPRGQQGRIATAPLHNDELPRAQPH